VPCAAVQSADTFAHILRKGERRKLGATLWSIIENNRQEKVMTTFKKSMFAAAIFPMGIYGSSVALGADVKVMLSGANEVPPVTTSASGDGALSIAPAGTVCGRVT